jgi:hypothetical protein
MRALSTQQFYAAAGTNAGTFGARTNRNETALAFGIHRRLEGGRLFDLDAVASILVDELTPAFGRKHAAGTIVIGHGDVWLAAVGRADAIQEPVFLVVAEFGAVVKGMHGFRKDVRVGQGTLGELFKQNIGDAQVPVPPRITLVNVTSILARVRANAARVGVDLAAPFFPPPDDPRARKLIDAAKRSREAALAMHFEGLIPASKPNVSKRPTVSKRVQ